MYLFKSNKMNAQNVDNVAEIEVIYKPTISSHPIIKSSLDSYQVLRGFFPDNTIALKEYFVVLYLNRANKVIGGHRISEGGMTGTVVDPRIVLGTALKVAATGIILSHNHPSGNLKPSKADELLTNKIKQGAFFMDIQVLDHLIFSPENGMYYSFSDEGII
jgi:DNA repair protein RadC